MSSQLSSVHALLFCNSLISKVYFTKLLMFVSVCSLVRFFSCFGNVCNLILLIKISDVCGVLLQLCFMHTNSIYVLICTDSPFQL